MENKELYENLPKGYLEKRRKSDLNYLWSFYLYCGFSLLASLGVISIDKGTIGNTISYLIIGLNVITMIIGYSTKRFYNNIPMINHGEIKVFTKKQVLLYLLPIIVTTPFIIEKFLRYFLFIGAAYVALSVFNKPIDAYDNARRRNL